MEFPSLEDQVKELFRQEGSPDVLYSTSDGKIFFNPVTAIANIRDAKLSDETMVTWFKDSKEQALRATAPKENDNSLQMLIFATDFVKRARFQKEPEPMYQEFKDFCAHSGIKPVEERSFDYIVERVYNFFNKVPQLYSEVPVLLKSQDIITGTVLKLYGFHKLVLFNDYMILTCPTNIELVAYSIPKLFSPILTPQTNIKTTL